ncbi:CsbD family protein [Roseobacter sp.]|uniref:CsbD family protein n=1 Tax=Roseobacter sp. TaxID=1907202 RepID=UPI002966DDD4|nr:CsbD family protein [Roseobacter sp.]MDW3182426.1 CsbD family protein [Roseobacter sp.]
MNWDIIKGNWKQMKGQVQSKWGELTDDEIDQAEGDRTRLAGLIQERYGVAMDEAERQIDAFIAEHKSAA